MTIGGHRSDFHFYIVWDYRPTQSKNHFQNMVIKSK